MAVTRFYVGGTGNTSDTAHWSTLSGGGGGASVPVAGDTANFDSGSGTGTATIDVALACATLTLSQAGLTVAGSAGLTVTGTVTVTAGTWKPNATTQTIGSFVSTSGTRTLTLDNSTINITGTSGAPWSVTSSGTLTITLTGSTINYSGGAAGIATNFSASSAAYNTVNIMAAGSVTINAAILNVKNLSYTSSTNKTDQLIIAGGSGVVIAASGSLTFAGNSVVNRAFVLSSTLSTQRTITVPNTATVTLTNVDFQDIASAGTFGTWTGTSLGDCLGNSGITFDASTTQTFSGTNGADNYSTAARWSSRVPLPQDDVTIGSQSASENITLDMPRLGRNLTWTSYQRALTGSITLTFYGNFSLPALTLPAVQFNVQGRGAQTITNNGGTFQQTLRVDAFGGSYTQQDAFLSTSTFDIRNGTWSANNFDFTANNFQANGANTKAITMGSGTWHLTKITTGTVFDYTAPLTITANTSTIKLDGSGGSGNLTFNGGGATFNNLWWSNTAATGTLIITGANTFNDFKINRTTARTIQFPAGPTTIGSWTDESLGTAILTLNGGGSSAKLTKASGTVSTDYLNVTNIDAPTSPDASLWYAGGHSTNVSGTRFIFTGPPTNVSVTGVAGTGAVGTVALQVSAVPSGVAGTGAVGAVIPTVAITTIGVVGTGQVGTVGFQVSTGIQGVSGTGQVGTVTTNTATDSLGIYVPQKYYDFLRDKRRQLEDDAATKRSETGKELDEIRSFVRDVYRGHVQGDREVEKSFRETLEIRSKSPRHIEAEIRQRVTLDVTRIVVLENMLRQQELKTQRIMLQQRDADDMTILLMME